MRNWALAIAGAFASLLAACASDGGARTAQTQCAAPGVQAGLSEHQLQSGGVARTYKLYVPDALPRDRPAPLVLDLHGTGGSPDGQLRVSRLREAADARGFVVVALAAAVPRPGGGGFAWNVPARSNRVDDVRYAEDVIAAVSAQTCVDQNRIYAMGYSGGARMASELACQRPERFAAISAVAGLRHPRGEEGACLSEGGAAPIIAFHGDADGVNRYALDPAAPNPTWTYGVEEAVSRWGEAMDCEAEEPAQVAASVELRGYRCRAGAEIAFYRIIGGGHTWPGNDVMHPAMGPTTMEVDATALSLDFFEAHRRTP